MPRKAATKKPAKKAPIKTEAKTEEIKTLSKREDIMEYLSAYIGDSTDASDQAYLKRIVNQLAFIIREMNSKGK